MGPKKFIYAPFAKKEIKKKKKQCLTFHKKEGPSDLVIADLKDRHCPSFPDKRAAQGIALSCLRLTVNVTGKNVYLLILGFYSLS